MAPLPWWARIVVAFEDRIVHQILQIPAWHRGVRFIHRRINNARYGRNPDEPLYPGEATEDPTTQMQRRDFMKYFTEELDNQWKGKATNLPPDPPRAQPTTKSAPPENPEAHRQ